MRSRWGTRAKGPLIDRVSNGLLNHAQLSQLHSEFSRAVQEDDHTVIEKFVDKFGAVTDIVNRDVKFLNFNALEVIAYELKGCNDSSSEEYFKARVQTFQLLLSAKGIGVNRQYNHGDTIINDIITAASLPKWVKRELLTTMLNCKRVDVNLCSKRDAATFSTPLLTAVMLSSLPSVKLLLQRKDLDVNLKPQGSWFPIIAAANLSHRKHKSRHEVMAELLKRDDLELDAVDEEGKTALHIATQEGDLEMVRLLKGVNPNIQDALGYTALHYAVEAGNDAMVDELLSREGVDPNVQTNCQQMTALHLAFRAESIDKVMRYRIINALLLHPATRFTLIDSLGFNALQLTAFYGEAEHVGVMLAKKPEVAVTGEKGKEEEGEKQKVFAEKVDIDAQRDNGDTALITALKKGHEKTALELMGCGACVIIRNSTHDNALAYAVTSNSLKVLGELLGNRDVNDVAVNGVSTNGNSPLHWAASLGYTAALKLLLRSGKVLAGDFGVDMQNKEGDTALMLAAEHGDVSMVKALVAAGANVMLENSKDEKPSEIALRCGKPAIAKVLIGQEMRLGAFGNVSNISMFKPVTDTGGNAAFSTYVPSALGNK
jgi:ankyrin repeat protein